MNKFPPIPQSSISSRRKSQSPTRVTQSPSVVAEKMKDKENIAPASNSKAIAATTPSTKPTIESPSSEGRKKESRKKRKSLNRRVSFSQTVDVRTFIKGDDWKNASPEEKEKQEEKEKLTEVTATPITKLVAPVQPDETLFDLPEDTLSVNVADTLMVTEEDTATFQGTDSVLKDFMAKSPLKKAALPDLFPSPEPVAITTTSMPMEVEESDIEKLEKKRSLRKSRNSFSPTQASLHEFLNHLQADDADSNTITMDASNPTMAKILANLRGESAASITESPAVNRSSRRRSSGVMKTPDLKRFINDIEPEDSVIAHSPSEFLAQLSKQQQNEEIPDSPISEFNLEDTINQPTFMRTPSISKLLKDTALPEEPSTITMTQDQVTSMLTPSLARLLSKTRRESTDGPRESLSGMTFMNTPNLSKLLSKTQIEDSPISPLNMEDTVSQATFMRTPNLQKLLSKTAPDSVEKNSASKTPSMKKFLLEAQDDDSLSLSPSEFQGEVSMIAKSPAKSPAVTKLLPKASPTRSAVVQSPARSRRSLAESTPQKPAESPARKNSLIHRILSLSPGKEQQTVDILALTRNQYSSPELDQKLKDYEFEQLLAQPVSVKEFLYHYDLGFLDDVSNRKPSVLCAPVQRTFVSAREKVQMSATKSAEKAVFEWGCDELSGINASIIEEVKAAEEYLASNNPSIFKSVHMAESENEVKSQLKQMKSICKKEAKESWYEWRVRLEKSYTERLVDNLELLRNDHQKLVEMMDEVSDLRGAMKDDVKSFLATKGVKDVPNDGDDLTIFVTPVAKEDIELSHSKQEIVRILSSLLPYKVQTLSPAEIVLHINEQFVLHMVYDREENKITHKAIAPLSGARVDRFTEALVESANINSVLANLDSVSQLREILNEVSFRLGRIADLQKELAQLNRTFTVRCKKTSSEPGGQVEVEFSNMDKFSKFSLTFDVQYSYPCGPLNYAVNTLFGEVPYEAIQKIVKNIPARFGRLTNICKAIKQL